MMMAYRSVKALKEGFIFVIKQVEGSSIITIPKNLQRPT
jgi:hypothetical protein